MDILTATHLASAYSLNIDDTVHIIKVFQQEYSVLLDGDSDGADGIIASYFGGEAIFVS